MKKYISENIFHGSNHGIDYFLEICKQYNRKASNKINCDTIYKNPLAFARISHPDLNLLTEPIQKNLESHITESWNEFYYKAYRDANVKFFVD